MKKRQPWPTGFKKIGDGIYTWITKGSLMYSNVLLVEGDDCALMFDCFSTKPMTQAFLDEYKKISDKPIKYYVISHEHGDHFLGAKALKEFSDDLTVIGHCGLKEAFEFESAHPRTEQFQKQFPEMDYSDPIIPFPDIYIDGDIKIDLGNRIVEIKPAGNCHTPTDIYLCIPDAGIIAAGDILFIGVAPASMIGDLDHWVSVLDTFLKSDCSVFIPGHGPIASKEDIEELKAYFNAVREQARALNAGSISWDDNYPSEVEQKYLIDNGWIETTRCVFSTEQYAAKLKGEKFIIDRPRLYKLETIR